MHSISFMQIRMRCLQAGLFALMIACANASDAKCASPTPLDTAHELRAVISERLAVMPAVAQFKWNKGIPVEDLPRERVILDSLTKKAQRAGVDPSFAEAFFKDQIDAAKRIQRALIAQWRNEGHPPFEYVPDLKTDIRPKLDKLTGRLLLVLGKVENHIDPEQLGRILRPVPEQWAHQPVVWETAVQSLSKSTSR